MCTEHHRTPNWLHRARSEVSKLINVKLWEFYNRNVTPAIASDSEQHLFNRQQERWTPGLHLVLQLVKLQGNKFAQANHEKRNEKLDFEKTLVVSLEGELPDGHQK